MLVTPHPVGESTALVAALCARHEAAVARWRALGSPDRDVSRDLAADEVAALAWLELVERRLSAELNGAALLAPMAAAGRASVADWAPRRDAAA